MRTLVKWIQNDNTQSSNVLITRTLGKIGALHRESIAAMSQKPKAGEWWYSEVVKETGAGTARGLWVLNPVERVPRIEKDGFRDHDLNYLVPAMFTPYRSGNALLLFPKRKGPHWICHNPMRRHLIRSQRHAGSGDYQVNSVVVVFDDQRDWPKEFTSRGAPLLNRDGG